MNTTVNTNIKVVVGAHKEYANALNAVNNSVSTLSANQKEYLGVLRNVDSSLATTKASSLAMSRSIQGELPKISNSLDKMNNSVLVQVQKMQLAYKVASKLWDSAEMTAKLDDNKRAIQGLAAEYGTSADAMVNSIQTAADGTVSQFTALDIANKGFQAGLNPEQIKVFTEAAENLGDKVGLDAATAFDKIVEAVNNGDTEMLKHFGIVADLSGEYAKYGNNLTDAEKKAINLKVVSAALGESMANMGQKIDTPSDQVAQLNAKMENIQLTLGNAVVFLVDKFIKFGEWLGETAAKIVTAFENAINAIKAFPKRAYDAGVTLVKEFIAGIKSKAEESYNAVFSDI